MRLTGKEVYAAYVSVWPKEDQGKLTPFDELYEDTQKIYEGIARRINEAHIAPLQEFVQEFITLLEDPDLMIEDCTDGWYEHKEKTLAEAKKLLGVRQHQYHLKRQYQFPNAALSVIDGYLAGWVVNLPLQKDLYGVVRYSPHGDDVAWIESRDHFGTDKARAETWVREQVQQIKEETNQ